MKPIGTKSLLLSALFFTMAYLAAKGNDITEEHIQYLSGQAQFCIGLFSVLMGVSIYSFLALKEKSRSYLRFAKIKSKTEGELPVIELFGYAFLVGRKL